MVIMGFLDSAFMVNSKNFSELNEQFEKDKDSIDLIFFGSSHSYSSFNTAMIDKTFNINSYNFGTSAQLMISTNFLLRESLKKSKPKLIILDIYEATFVLPETDKSKAFQLEVFDNTRFSLDKLKLITEIYDSKEIPSVISQVIRNHNQWYDLPIFSEGENDVDVFNKGFQMSNREINETERLQFKDFDQRQNNYLNDISDDQTLEPYKKEMLIEFVALAKKNNIEVLLVTAPYIGALYNEKFMRFNKAINKLSDSLDLNYIDFNNKYKDLNLKFSDFRDESHLNTIGANKVTAILSKHLADEGYFDLKNSNYLNSNLENIALKHFYNDREVTKSDKRIFAESILQKGESISQGHEFSEEFTVNDIIYYSDFYNRVIAMEYDDSIEGQKYLNDKDKAFGVVGIVSEKDFDNLPDYIRAKDIKTISWKSDMQTFEINKKAYILLFLKRHIDVEDFKQLKVFLRDTDEYKGTIGNAFIWNNANIVEPQNSEENFETIIKESINTGFELHRSHSFADELNINKLIFYSDATNQYIAIEYQKPFSEIYLEDKAFGIRALAYDEDIHLLPDWLQQREGNKHLTWNCRVEKKDINGSEFIILTIDKKCKIDKWKSLRIFLIDKDEYKGTIGRPLELNDVKFIN